jgi:hypothetical protein
MGGAYEREEKWIQGFGEEGWQRLLVRPRHRWEDNIKMGLIYIGCNGMDWINLAQDRDMVNELLWTQYSQLRLYRPRL